jgi:N-acetylmuramoyl-L-alanine amidase
VIHATTTGSGVHLYTSALQPPEEDASANLALNPRSAFVPVRWEMVQSAFVSQSLGLASDLSAALGKASLPVVAGREPVRPLDNLECPAVVLELAPLLDTGGDATPVTDADYQQRIAATLTTALQAWRDHVEPTATSASATGAGGAATTDPAAKAMAAAEAARAAAEAAGKTAVKAHAPVGVSASSQAQGNKVKANGESNASPASSSTGPGDQSTQTGGTQ